MTAPDLEAILGNGEQLLNALPKGDVRHEDAEEILQAGRRAADLTRQLLAFSRQQETSPQALDLNLQLQSLERTLRRLVGEDVELELVLDPRLHRCWIDAGQFEQAIMNLVVNARDAMPDGGRLTIETANV